MPDEVNASRRSFIQKLILSSAAIGTGMNVPAAIAASQKSGIIGQQMPPLEAKFWIDGEGNKTTFNMKELENKWVFLKCFQNWCPGCHKHGFPTLKKIYDEFGQNPRVAILGIQTVFEGHLFNKVIALRENQLKYKVPIKMGHDPGGDSTDDRSKTMINYRTGGTPWLIVANPEGKVIFNDFHIDPEKFISYLHEQLDQTPS